MPLFSLSDDWSRTCWLAHKRCWPSSNALFSLPPRLQRALTQHVWRMEKRVRVCVPRLV